ncbi:hypothetical protein OG765_14095 [Streptomyces sp. NBC_00555]|uniref:hypothetical protein n=1 Tax=Streptomyces sp. NBC_00555 TaxID=2903662 RepID=UPI0022501C43|nr:hypothetical protein [Streptomyces sp. NBC_00555]MCX5012117.1 hypothetical protein [Streptomyces sp. NBC_00555]
MERTTEHHLGPKAAAAERERPTGEADARLIAIRDTDPKPSREQLQDFQGRFPRAIALPRRLWPAPGTTVRAMEAPEHLAVGVLARYGTPTDGFPGYGYVRPLEGGREWVATPDYLRPAHPMEISAVRIQGWAR